MSTQTTIEVQYVNEPKPGKTKGSVKTRDGAYYGVWADKLSEFKPGGTYEIEYEESQFQGKTYRNINTSKGVKKISTTEIYGTGSGGGGSVSASGGTYKYSTSPTDAERMFVCSLMNAYIESGKIMLNPTELLHATNMLREVWRDTFGRDE